MTNFSTDLRAEQGSHDLTIELVGLDVAIQVSQVCMHDARLRCVGVGHDMDGVEPNKTKQNKTLKVDKPTPLH